MEIQENKTNPWKHPYYSLIKNMYHPFLFHNHLYCELTDESLRGILAERDAYVIIMEARIVGMRLTLEERNWVYYLRDCCLFEQHKRNFNNVMSELLQHTKLRPTRNWQNTVLSQHSKVIQWLRSNQQVYATGDFLRDKDEYPERLEESIYSAQPPDSPRVSAQPPDSPRVSEGYIDFLKLPPENPVNPETKAFNWLPSSEPVTQYIKRPPITLGQPTSDSEQEFPIYPGQSIPSEKTEVEKRTSVLVMWPDYPREMLEKYPELFVPRTIESLGKLLCDPEYIKEYDARKQELKLLAKRRDKILQEYKKLEAENKRQEEIRRQRMERDEEIRQQILAKMAEIQKEREDKERRERQERYCRRRGIALNPTFVESAIKTALKTDYKETPKKEKPVAEQATTSKSGRIVITWDEITESIKEMNKAVKEKLAEKERKSKTKFPTPPSSTESYIVKKASFERFLRKHSKKQPPKWLDNTDAGGYIGPGTYEVPQTGANYNVLTGMPLITVKDNFSDDDDLDYDGHFVDDDFPYEYADDDDFQEDDGSRPVYEKICPDVCEASISSSENDYRYSTGKRYPELYEPSLSPSEGDDENNDGNGQVNPKICSEVFEPSTSRSEEDKEPSSSKFAPPVPKFVESDKDSDSSTSTLPSVIQAEGKSADADDDEESITSEDIRKFDLDYSIEHTEPPDELFAPSPPPMSSDDGRDESTVSDSDFDCTLPEIEPDFMNLPLPETPEERKYK